MWGSGNKNKLIFGDLGPSDQKIYILEIFKIRKRIDWQPQISLEDGVGEFC